MQTFNILRTYSTWYMRSLFLFERPIFYYKVQIYVLNNKYF